MNRAREILLYTGLGAILLLPRIPALNAFSTLDEPDWLSMGANFYYALGQREFQNTVYEYQPAVTTMWIVTAGMLMYFPEYRGLGQGYLEYQKDVFDPFLLKHGKDPLVLLQDSRLIQVLLIAGLMLFAFYLMQRLIGKGAALFSILLVSFEPFFLGQSRLLDHEAMLALFCLISVLALLNYLLQGRKIIFIIISGVSAALAQLTKSSGIALLVPVGLIFLIDLFEDQRTGVSFRKSLSAVFKAFGIWFAVLAITYIILWPGMWVAPGKMLYQVYGNAFSYAFRGARLTAIDNSQTTPLSLDANLVNLGQLIDVILGRTTPVTWLGVFFGLILSFTRDLDLGRPTTRWGGLLMLVLAISFVLMFGLAQGRNSPHYTLTSYVALGVFAGMGWYHMLALLGKRVTLLHSNLAQAFILLTALASQAWSAAAYYPYYFTYENPILAALAPRESPQFAYGEGLELAARYMSELPGAQDLTALVYYSRGCFSYFFPGHSERFKPYYVDAGYEKDLLKALTDSDYLVIYYAVQGHLDKYDKLLNALAEVKPEKEIWLNGYKYAVIYRVDSFPSDTYDAMVK